VIGLREGVPTGLGTVEVGDRTKIRSFGISGTDVVLEVVEAGPDDAMCCPTQLAHKTYGMEAGTLRIKSSDVTGTLSLALLAGEWTVVEIDGEPLPSGVDPPTATFDGDTVAGFSGCNRYRGTIKETAAGTIAVGPIAGTRMACPEPQMGLESRFFASLEKATQYTFLAGRLALSGMDGETMRSVLLKRP
jgi:heat shock protein HslJ